MCWRPLQTLPQQALRPVVRELLLRTRAGLKRLQSQRRPVVEAALESEAAVDGRYTLPARFKGLAVDRLRRKLLRASADGERAAEDGEWDGCKRERCSRSACGRSSAIQAANPAARPGGWGVMVGGDRWGPKIIKYIMTYSAMLAESGSPSPSRRASRRGGGVRATLRPLRAPLTRTGTAHTRSSVGDAPLEPFRSESQRCDRRDLAD